MSDDDEVVTSRRQLRVFAEEIRERALKVSVPLASPEQVELMKQAQARSPAQGEVMKAAIATEQSPALAVLHKQYDEYNAGITPLAAAGKVVDFIINKAQHGIPMAHAITELVENPEMMHTVVGTTPHTAPIKYTMNGGAISTTVDASNVDPWMLVMRGADSLTTGYLSMLDVIKARMAPGLIMANTKGLMALADAVDKTVWVVANSASVDPSYSHARAVLERPHYVFVADAPGVPDGMPMATGQECNEGTEGARRVHVLSSKTGTWKYRHVVLDNSPRWAYTAVGKEACLRFLHTAMSSMAASMGDAAQNLKATAMHMRIEKQAVQRTRDRVAIPGVSLHESQHAGVHASVRDDSD